MNKEMDLASTCIVFWKDAVFGKSTRAQSVKNVLNNGVRNSEMVMCEWPQSVVIII